MAETKTNIPVEIKMGNAGTNDTNLPAFKEGSIIFTKDTKKIYIDPVGETERIAVGGGEVDLSGKQDKFGTVSYASSPKYLMLSINGYVDPTSGKFIQLSSSDITSTHIDITNAEFSNKVKFNHSLIMGSAGNLGFDFELPTTTTPGKIKTSKPGLNKLNFSNGLGTSDIQLGGIKTPTADNDAANKKYVDDAIAASGGSSITIDSELSDTSTNPVQNKVINSALSNKLDKFTQPAGVQWNGLLYGVQDDGKTHSIQKMFDLCIDAIKDTIVLRNNKGEILCETPTDNVTDKHAVNIGYLTTKYGSTNYSSQDKEFYLPGGSNMVIPNTEMGRLFMGSEGTNSTDFKLYVNDPIDGGKLIITSLKTPSNDEDAANKAYVDTQVANKQDKFAEYTSTRPSEEAPASASTNILVLNEGMEFYLRDRATNPLVEFKINSSGALEGTTNYFSLTSKGAFNLKSNTFALSNDNDTPFQVVTDDSKKIVYYGLNGGDDNGSLYLTNTSRTGQQGATLQGNVSSDSRTTALVVNERNIKLLSWKQGTTTNNAPLLGVATPVEAADTSKGITAADLDYQAVNKKYIDDIKTELLNAINHPYTYDETTKELTLIL